jgi:cell division protein FtsB
VKYRSRAQVALAALAFVAVLFLFVFPTRAYLSQRRDVSAARHDVEVLRDQNKNLQSEALRLSSRAEIEQLARRHFHMVYPGEEVFNVLPAPVPGATTTTVP